MSATILMIEDDLKISRINKSALEEEGYRVLASNTLTQGKSLAKIENPDLILLEILLPDGNGLQYCRELYQSSSVRIMFLSTLNTKKDVVIGLRAGGDDYLTKPYLVDELLARVEALLRRSRISETYVKGALSFNTVKRQVYIKGKSLSLTATQYSLLLYLAQNEGKFISTQKISEEVWNSTIDDSRNAIKTTASHVRKKLKPFGYRIESKRDIGYRLRPL